MFFVLQKKRELWYSNLYNMSLKIRLTDRTTFTHKQKSGMEEVPKNDVFFFLGEGFFLQKAEFVHRPFFMN